MSINKTIQSNPIIQCFSQVAKYCMLSTLLFPLLEMPSCSFCLLNSYSSLKAQLKCRALCDINHNSPSCLSFAPPKALCTCICHCPCSLFNYFYTCLLLSKSGNSLRIGLYVTQSLTQQSATQ